MSLLFVSMATIASCNDRRSFPSTTWSCKYLMPGRVSEIALGLLRLPKVSRSRTVCARKKQRADKSIQPRTKRRFISSSTTHVGQRGNADSCVTDRFHGIETRSFDGRIDAENQSDRNRNQKRQQDRRHGYDGGPSGKPRDQARH